MTFDPRRLAILYYFGEVPYWKLPSIAVEALEKGFDGPSLRRLAALDNPVASDMRQEQVDAAFREMGVDAPISKAEARLTLAEECANNALRGDWNVFDEATRIRIYVCELEPPPPELAHIVRLSKNADRCPHSEWDQLEAELRAAMTEFVDRRRK